MYRGIVEIIFENLTERLDGAAFHADEYVKADEAAKEKLENLQSVLGKGQAGILEAYLEAASYREVIYSEVSYRQGMKDIVALMLSLIDF